MSNDRSADRRAQLRYVAESYLKGLQTQTFEAIPFHPNVTLRAPIAPGGSERPLHGRDAIFRDWWQPLKPALANLTVTLYDYYYNDSLTGVIAEADITLTALPQSATARVADRFTVDANGLIIEQENHFDPRNITNPGWDRSS